MTIAVITKRPPTAISAKRKENGPDTKPASKSPQRESGTLHGFAHDLDRSGHQSGNQELFDRDAMQEHSLKLVALSQIISNRNMKDIQHAFGRPPIKRPDRDVPCVTTGRRSVKETLGTEPRHRRSRAKSGNHPHRIDITAIRRTEGFECRRSQTKQVGLDGSG